jgi:4-alpha-glucanotransferase
MSGVAELAQRCGIASAFVDARGERRETTIDTQAALLAAMGFAADAAHAGTALEELDAGEWRAPLPPVTVHRTPGPPSILLTLAAETQSVRWRLTLESGDQQVGEINARSLATVAARTVDGIAYLRRRALLGEDVPFGYHLLELEPGGARMVLIVAPPRCWLPPELESGERLWGLTTQLFLLRSTSDWGIGDFGDLRQLVEIVKPLGADVIGVNPLHALFPDQPEHASPYSPASRLLLNVLNIDVAELAGELNDEAVLERIAARDFQSKLSRCRESPSVRYAEVASLKLPVLRALFESVSAAPGSAAAAALQRFDREASVAFKRHCVFLALREYFVAGQPELADWHRWPKEFQDPDSNAVREFVAEHADEVAFQLWLQQVADSQLGAAATAAAPMAIGLYRDLAVGADPAGAETWANQRAVVAGAHVGAPPDIYNPPGQDWGLPPFNPRALREEGYGSFVDLLRANMRHARGLRIDHVMALLHLYWIPAGLSPKAGAYVDYPLEDLLGVLALESHRHECIVVGEDLGTVPDGFRERMTAANVLSYRVLFFERDEHGMVPPDHYPELALAVFSSHDLPTLRAWWEGTDLELKDSLGLYPTPAEARTAVLERTRDRQALLEALRREGLSDAPLDVDALFIAAHAFLARSRAAIATVQIDDLTDEHTPVNVPATSDEYPNWRRRLSQTLDEIAAGARLAAAAQVLNAERGMRRRHE